MVATFILIATLITMVAELWMGIAVTAFQQDCNYVLRSEKPVAYWAEISFHALIAFDLPLLAFAAGI